jgi:hypothetical protein
MDGFKIQAGVLRVFGLFVFFSRFAASSVATVFLEFLTVDSVTFGGIHENV